MEHLEINLSSEVLVDEKIIAEVSVEDFSVVFGCEES